MVFFGFFRSGMIAAVILSLLVQIVLPYGSEAIVEADEVLSTAISEDIEEAGEVDQVVDVVEPEAQPTEETALSSDLVEEVTPVEEEEEISDWGITPALSVWSGEVLYGGEMLVVMTMKNTGENVAYNAGFEVVLPRGFEYVEFSEDDFGDNSSEVLSDSLDQERWIERFSSYFSHEEDRQTLVHPTFVSVEQQVGEDFQVVRWNSMADLLPGEEVRVAFISTVGGKDEGYEIGQQVDFSVTGLLYPRADFSDEVMVVSEQVVELLPFVSRVETNGQASTPLSQTVEGGQEVLVEENQQQRIVVETNPEVESLQGDSSSEGFSDEPMVVQFELDNGVEYVEDSQQLEGYEGNYDFFWNDTEGVNTLLTWVLYDVVAVASEIVFDFQTLVERYDEDDREYVEHGEQLEQQARIDARYEGCGEVPLSEEIQDSCAVQERVFSQQEQSSVEAKYFTVEKWGTPYLTDTGEIVRYHVHIETSPAYALSGIEVRDVLPDGVNFVGNIGFSEDLGLELLAQTFLVESGQEELVWRMTDEDGMAAGQAYDFWYDVEIPAAYDVLSLSGDHHLLASDSLQSLVSLRGVWAEEGQEALRTGVDEDNAGAHQRIVGPIFASGVRHLESQSLVLSSDIVQEESSQVWDEHVDVKIGDVVEVFGEITFPSTVPTQSVRYQVYIPVGTRLVGEPVVDALGEFEHSPTQFSVMREGESSGEALSDGIGEDVVAGDIQALLFDLGRVQPGANLRVSYQLEVLDDVNMSLAVVTRNLFRGEYQNIAGQGFTNRDDITLQVVEPQVVFGKKVVSGYLAKGEKAIVELWVENRGTDAAFDVMIEDEFLTNNVYLGEVVEADERFAFSCESGDGQDTDAGALSDVISGSLEESLSGTLSDTLSDTLSGDLAGVLENVDIPVLEDQQCVMKGDFSTLLPGEKGVVRYEVFLDETVEYGDQIESLVTLSSYTNRAADDQRVTRLYEGQERRYGWLGREALLVTGFETIESVSVQAEEVVTERSNTVSMRAYVENVGGAPVYALVAALDWGQLPIDFSVEYLDVQGFNADLQAEVLLPGQKAFVEFEVQVPKWVESGETVLFSWEASGKNALNEDIEKDGSQRTARDFDDDDASSLRLVVDQQDFVAPIGEILFGKLDDDNTFEGDSFEVTNESLVDVVYQAADWSDGGDSLGEVVGARFSQDGDSWYALDTYGLLTSDQKSILGVEQGQWNSCFLLSEEGVSCGDEVTWIEQNVFLPLEGQNIRFAQFVDIAGNVSTVQGRILLDQQPPEMVYINISPFAGDLSDPPVTGVRENYLVFHGEDYAEAISSAGMGEYRYCLPITTECVWSSWEKMESGVNSVAVDFSQQLPETVDREGESFSVEFEIRDLAGNVFMASLYDEIVYVEEFPQIGIVLDQGAEYTAEAGVEVGLTVEVPSYFPLQKVRFGDFVENLQEATWQPYTLGQSLSQVLPMSFEDGNKKLCVQVQDTTANSSNIACDEIVLDTTAPNGFFLINEGVSEVDTRAIELHTAVSDPAAVDGSSGIGGVQMRWSTVGENCLFLQEEEQAACQQQWSAWEEYQETIPWELSSLVGEQTIYLQLRDALENTSEVISGSVLYNPYTGTGNIVINGNLLFTNTKYVELDLSLETTEEIAAQPVLMKLVQTEGQAGPPPLNAVSWGDWHEYSPNVQWNLDEGNNGAPHYGQKNVYVVYKLPTGEEIGWYVDSIIYAPYYAVEYESVEPDGVIAESDQTNLEIRGEYSLDDIPLSVVTLERFHVALNAKNRGSFTWPVAGENPVRLTYSWIRVGGQLPAGIPQEIVPTEIRGNATSLYEVVGWNEETGYLELRVDTPVYPGEYELVIDTVHEGKAWFGDWANETPTFSITVEQNPAMQEPTVDPELVPASSENEGVNQEGSDEEGEQSADQSPSGDEDQEELEQLALNEDAFSTPLTPWAMGAQVPISTEWESDGWGHNCNDTWGNNSNSTCYIQGIWNVNRNTNYQQICASYGGYYQYEIEVAPGRVFNFCPGNTAYWDQFLSTQMTAKVQFGSGSGFGIKGIKPARQYYEAQYRTSDNDARWLAPVPVNRSQPGQSYTFPVQPRVYNSGTGIWNSNTFLVSVDRNGNEISSPLASSDWHSPSRMGIAGNQNGWGQGTLAPFNGSLTIPEDIPLGYFEQCFQVKQDGVHFERSDVFCYTLDVQLTQEEERQYLCSQPQLVYQEPNQSSEVLSSLQQDSYFIVSDMQEIDGQEWYELYLPDSLTGDKGWTLNQLDCFSAPEIIENIIPVPEFPVLPEPEGDTGYVIRLEGIDVKNGPADGFDTIAHIPYGEHVQVIGEAHLEDHQYGGWILIRLDDGTEGWVPKGTVQHLNDPPDIEVNLRPEFARGHVCAASPINAFPAPGLSSPVIGTLEPDQNIPVIKTWKNWFQVYLNAEGDTGWISSLDGLCEGFVWPKTAHCGGGEMSYPYESQQRYSPVWGGFRSGNRPNHNGIDLGAAYGTPVLAAHDGYIKSYSTSGTPGGAAKYVTIKSDAMNLYTGYWHLSSVHRTSGAVKKGEIIGFTGNTGNVYCMIGGSWVRPPAGSICGSHLHFFVYSYSAGDFVNPWDFLNGGGGELQACVEPGGGGDGASSCGSDATGVCYAQDETVIGENPFAGILMEEIAVEPDGPDLTELAKLVGKDIADLMSIVSWNPFQDMWEAAHFLYGLGKGAVNSIWGVVEMAWDVISSFGVAFVEMVEALGEVISNPSILKYLFLDLAEKYLDEDKTEKRMQMIGELVGEFIPDIAMMFAGGVGGAKIIAKVVNVLDDISSSLKYTLRISRLANKVKDVRVAGILLNKLKFTGKATSLVDDLYSSMKHLNLDDYKTVLNAIDNITPKQKAYMLIKKLRGNVDDVLGYVIKNDEVVWLEKGTDASGWKHILNGHEQDFYRKFGNIGQEGIKKKIIEAVNKGNRTIKKDIINGKERVTIVYEYKGTRVNVATNGYIVSANPI